MAMHAEKYNRQVTLLCSTCGGTQFEHEDDNLELVRCTSCQREMTRDELIRENSENIAENAKEIGEQVKKDVADELTKAFGSLKNFKIR